MVPKRPDTVRVLIVWPLIAEIVKGLLPAPATLKLLWNVLPSPSRTNRSTEPFEAAFISNTILLKVPASARLKTRLVRSEPLPEMVPVLPRLRQMSLPVLFLSPFRRLNR